MADSNVDTEEQRKQIVMELLWIQQAINSRKQVNMLMLFLSVIVYC